MLTFYLNVPIFWIEKFRNMIFIEILFKIVFLTIQSLDATLARILI